MNNIWLTTILKTHELETLMSFFTILGKYYEKKNSLLVFISSFEMSFLLIDSWQVKRTSENRVLDFVLYQFNENNNRFIIVLKLAAKMYLKKHCSIDF